MPTSEPKLWTCSTQPGLDGGDQGRVRVQREVRGDLALQPQPFGIGRQDQLDGGGVEADAVVQPLHAIGLVDALDRQHGAEDLRLGDLRRVAGEQRLDIEARRRDDDEVHPVARHVDARHLVDQFVHLGDDDALLEGGRLDHHRRDPRCSDPYRDCRRDPRSAPR